MGAFLSGVRHTSCSSSTGICRALLGLLFLSTGVMKFAVPSLRNAFAGQLTEAGLPFHSLNMWLVPLLAVVLGAMLIVGLYSRVASLVAILMMMVATYVHLVVDNPDLFPLQPEAPIIPLVTILLCSYVFWAGGGLWSLDLRWQQSGAT